MTFTVSLLAAAVAVLVQLQIPPAPRGYGTVEADVVVDAARVLPAEAVARINRIAFDVHAKARGEIALVTIPDIGDAASSDVALAVIRGWGVGSAAKIGDEVRNAGTVILIVPKETSSTGRGQCRIETGYGTEGFITDAEAGAICRAATPLFQAQDYGGAAQQLATRVAELYAREFGFALDTSLVAAAAPVYRREPVGDGGGGGFNPISLIVLFFIVISVLSAIGGRGRGGRGGRGGCGGGGFLPLYILSSLLSSGSRGGGWGGGGFGSGGGFGGGGGGGFGGFGGGGGGGGGGGSSW